MEVNYIDEINLKFSSQDIIEIYSVHHLPPLIDVRSWFAQEYSANA